MGISIQSLMSTCLQYWMADEFQDKTTGMHSWHYYDQGAGGTTAVLGVNWNLITTIITYGITSG